MGNKAILIGYSGHAYVVADILQKAGYQLGGYCDNEEKLNNPYAIPYIGKEKQNESQEILRRNNFFIAS